MSGFKSFKASKASGGAPASDEIERDPRACWANGCTCFGTVEIDGGRKFCSFHINQEPEDWNRITQGLRENRWLTELMLDVQSAKLDSGWVPLVIAFWSEDHYMRPTDSEQKHKHNYWQRLHGELEYRLGLRKKRPKPSEIAQIQPRRVAGWSRA